MRSMKRVAFACAAVAVLLVGSQAAAQQPGGPPASIVFYTARDGHPNNQIYLMNPDGSVQLRVTTDTASDVDPDISPNGQNIVFTSNQPGNNDIFVLDRTGQIKNLTNNPANDEWARWSPNGKQILFDSNREGGMFEIYVMNADGSAQTRLTDTSVLSRYASWSPDGKQIAFRHGIDIYTMNADGTGTPNQLTHEVPPSFAQMPVYSPNGQSIAFMSTRNGYCSVFRMNADGSDQVELTPRDPAVAPSLWCSRAPAWSADGQKIYFMSSRSGVNQVWMMNADNGKELQQLTSSGASGSPRAR